MKESALTQQSDCKWVRALDSNGNSILISKEDLASVVGELLPAANYTINGMMSKNYCIRNLINASSGGKDYMFKISGQFSYAAYELLAVSDDGRMLLCTFVFSPFGASIKPTIIKQVEFTGYIKFFRKEGDNISTYFKLNTGYNATSLFIRCLTANYDLTSVISSDESEDSLIEIPMI